MTGSFVRDKDAVSSCALIAETAAWARERGQTLLDLLEQIYVDYSFYKEHLISIVRKGKTGLEQIEAMMERFRSQPPESLGGSDVVMLLDFQAGRSYDLISHLRYDINLPQSNVLQFVMQDGSIVSVRPSGTEPKIKFYFSVRARVAAGEDIPAKEKELEDRIRRMVTDMNLEN
jgi:phosphoglucomutase